jgi:hypothetical protein
MTHLGWANRVVRFFHRNPEALVIYALIVIGFSFLFSVYFENKLGAVSIYGR